MSRTAATAFTNTAIVAKRKLATIIQEEVMGGWHYVIPV